MKVKEVHRGTVVVTAVGTVEILQGMTTVEVEEGMALHLLVLPEMLIIIDFKLKE